MSTAPVDIHNSPLFNKTVKSQLPSQNFGSPDRRQSPGFPTPDFRKVNEVPLGQPQFIEELYGTARKPRSFKQWEDYARDNTLKIKEQGSPSPLVWVFVKGKDIPPNAIIAGEERRQPLYIARTFYEGGICIGKAGRHLERGAAIPFNGSEVHVDSYEVLVPALQPLRFTISQTTHIPIIPRIMADGLTDKPSLRYPTPIVSPPMNKGIERLNMIKTVILLDDSSSMAGALWADAREALAGITELNAQVSADGVDVYFMNDHRFATNCRDGNEVRRLFSTVHPSGETPIGRKLQELFDKYIPLIENERNFHRPITIVVITDGVPSDEPTDVIVKAARRLDMNNVPLKKFGVQFAQIGDDPEATEALQELDDDLSRAYNIRDMVDTTPFNPHNSYFTSDTLVKILLGAVNEELDSVLSPNASNTPLLY